MKGGDYKMYWLTALLGIMFAASPFVLQYSDNQPALWTSLLVGAGLVVASAFEAAEHDKDPLEYGLIGLIGLAAIAAPFFLEYTEVATAMWVSIIGGGLVGAASLGRVFLKPDLTYG